MVKLEGKERESCWERRSSRVFSQFPGPRWKPNYLRLWEMDAFGSSAESRQKFMGFRRRFAAWLLGILGKLHLSEDHWQLVLLLLYSHAWSLPLAGQWHSWFGVCRRARDCVCVCVCVCVCLGRVWGIKAVSVTWVAQLDIKWIISVYPFSYPPFLCPFICLSVCLSVCMYVHIFLSQV